MKRNIIQSIQIIILSLIVTFVSCSEDQGPKPVDSNSNAPEKVTNIEVENLQGKVKLTYTLPSNKDLLYVKANYNLENGTEMEVKSSYYNNSMILEGFSGTKEIKVKISAVNRSEIASEPTEVTVSPLLAPIYDVYKTLEVSNDFGGIRVKAINDLKENLAILLMQKNSSGDWEPSDKSIYTSSLEINKAIRGYDTIPIDFAIAIRDRWLNVSDTLFTTITPLFETVIPTSNYRGITLDNDQPTYGNPVSNLWNGQYYWPNVYVTLRDDTTENHTVTMDMGVKAKLSRVKIWDYPETVAGVKLYYYLGSMLKFRIWGRISEPEPSGAFDNWILLGEYNSTKPSGLPYGQQDNNDVLAAKAGFDYEIPIDAPEVRYIRIQCLENYSGGESLAIADLLMYGKVVN